MPEHRECPIVGADTHKKGNINARQRYLETILFGHPDKVPANVIPTAADLAADLDTEITDEDIAQLLGGDVDTTEGG